MGRKLIDLTGRKFGRLLVLERVENTKDNKPQWKCKCDCGNNTIVSSANLKSGSVKSCGCYIRELSSKMMKKHGMAGTRLYNIWFSMKQRCYYTKNKCYNTYGAEGKTVCSEWLDKENGFINFYNWSMAHGYKDDLTIDRIDNNKGYSPENCRWITNIEQQNNKRNNHMIEYKGKKQTMSQWSKELNINYGTLSCRIHRYHWSIEKALNTPVK